MVTMPRIPPTLDPHARTAPPRRKAPRPIGKRVHHGWRRYWRRVLIALVAFVALVTVVPVALLRVVPVWTSSFMIAYQLEGLVDSDLPALRHTWVPWDEIAPAAKLAVIAAEDQRFADHFGLDLNAINQALEQRRRSGRVRGASTISQQVAKNLFLWSGQNWVRKGLEVGYTLLIEFFWSKQRILEVYLNIAEFGEGVYGVEAAAQRYFGKSAARLTYHEAALLAAVLPSPKRFSVASPSPYVLGRAHWIQGQMHQLGPQLLDDL